METIEKAKIDSSTAMRSDTSEPNQAMNMEEVEDSSSSTQMFKKSNSMLSCQSSSSGSENKNLSKSSSIDLRMARSFDRLSEEEIDFIVREVFQSKSKLDVMEEDKSITATTNAKRDDEERKETAPKQIESSNNIGSKAIDNNNNNSNSNNNANNNQNKRASLEPTEKTTIEQAAAVDQDDAKYRSRHFAEHLQFYLHQEKFVRSFERAQSTLLSSSLSPPPKPNRSPEKNSIECEKDLLAHQRSLMQREATFADTITSNDSVAQLLNTVCIRSSFASPSSSSSSTSSSASSSVSPLGISPSSSSSSSSSPSAILGRRIIFGGNFGRGNAAASAAGGGGRGVATIFTSSSRSLSANIKTRFIAALIALVAIVLAAKFCRFITIVDNKK